MTDIGKREVKQLKNSGLSRTGISVLASHRLLMSADRFTSILSCCQNERNCWWHQLCHGHSSLSHHCKTLQSSPPCKRIVGDSNTAHAHSRVNYILILPVDQTMEDWGFRVCGGSEVKSTCCSCRRSSFSSCYLHGGLQPSIAAMQGNLMLTSDIHG